MKNSAILLMALAAFNGAFGQEKTNSYSKFYLKPAGGINLPITKLLSGDITDNLIEYDDNTYYSQFVSGNYFFSPKWGVELTYQTAGSEKINNQNVDSNSALEKKYGDTYIVSWKSYANVHLFMGGSIHKGYLGVVYRIEKPRFVIMPKFALGITSFSTHSKTVFLKEKNSNSIYELSFEPEKKVNDNFMLAPSVTFGYKFSKRIMANVDVQYSYFKTNIKYTEEKTNLFNEEKTTIQTIDYKKNIHTLSIGLGLIIQLKTKMY